MGFRGFSIVPWLIFLSFIIKEEEYYRNILINEDVSIHQKNIVPKKIKHKLDRFEKNRNEILNYNEKNSKIYFLKYEQYSCRYDSYLLIQSYVINQYIS